MAKLSLTEARKNLSKVVSQTCRKEDAEITVRGETAAYLVSASRYKELRKAALKAEVEPIFQEFDELFKALADK